MKTEIERLRDLAVATAEAYVGDIPLPVRTHLQQDLVKIGKHLERGEYAEARLLAATLAEWESNYYAEKTQVRDFCDAVRFFCDAAENPNS